MCSMFNSFFKQRRLIPILSKEFPSPGHFIRFKSMGIPLTEVVKQLEVIAPLKLAESWDNVGLLVEPYRNKLINNVLLTIDLTEDVVEEAIETKSQLIISYHPNIFKPLKQVTLKYKYSAT